MDDHIETFKGLDNKHFDFNLIICTIGPISVKGFKMQLIRIILTPSQEYVSSSHLSLLRILILYSYYLQTVGNKKIIVTNSCNTIIQDMYGHEYKKTDCKIQLLLVISSHQTYTVRLL